MIVELREYHIHTGKLRELVDLYENEGIAIQKEALGNLLGWFITDVGALSTVVSMWGYDSSDERDKRRARLQQDERWPEFLKKIQPLIHTQQNRLLKPTRFSPIQ